MEKEKPKKGINKKAIIFMVFGLGVGISIGASFGSDLAIQMFNEANTLRILCEPNIPDICYEAFVGVDAKPLGKP